MSPDMDAMAEQLVLLMKGALTPVLAKQAAQQTSIDVWESRWSDLGMVRERMAVLESVSAQAVADAMARIAALETKAAPASDPAVLARLEAVEARPLIAGPEGPAGPAGPPGEGVPGRDGRDGLPGVPGVTEKGLNGIDGRNGVDGMHGKDGSDGLSFGDLTVVPEGDRGCIVRAVRGEQVKDLGSLTFAVPIWRGVYIEGKSYEPCDRVTYAGSEWHCNNATASKPGDGSKDWTLCIKRGRDGKDGRDAPSVPVVSVGAR